MGSPPGSLSSSPGLLPGLLGLVSGHQPGVLGRCLLLLPGLLPSIILTPFLVMLADPDLFLTVLGINFVIVDGDLLLQVT